MDDKKVAGISLSYVRDSVYPIKGVTEWRKFLSGVIFMTPYPSLYKTKSVVVLFPSDNNFKREKERVTPGMRIPNESPLSLFSSPLVVSPESNKSVYIYSDYQRRCHL